MVKSHVNYVVADTKKWEQTTAYVLDRNNCVDAFVKNEHLGFTIPYLHNGQPHDYVPDFVVRLKRPQGAEPLHLILETKGFDPLKDIKAQAAERWATAVNADRTYGRWVYRMVKSISEIAPVLALLHESSNPTA